MENKILENWKAIEEIEATVKEKTGDPKAGFNASSFWFGSDGRHLMIPCMYRGKKGKKGQEEFTNSYKEMMVYATFCPFTGKPLYEDSVSIVNQETKQLQTRIKELEQTIENMKAISLPKEEVVNGITSVDYPSDNETEMKVVHENEYGTILQCQSCKDVFIDDKFNYCPNCGRKIKK